MRLMIIVINQKEKKNLQNVQIYENLKKFMKSRSKSSKKSQRKV